MFIYTFHFWLSSHVARAFSYCIKVAGNPEFSRSTNLESKLIEFFALVNFKCTVCFGSLEPFNVRKIGDFPHLLSALASNTVFARSDATLN